MTASRARRPLSPRRFAITLALLALALPAFPLAAVDSESEGPLADLEYRNVGPVNMSGRVADVEGIPGDPRVVYVGSASGGVWKTDDGGLTFRPIFDDQPIASIGDLALAPSNPAVIYVGSGESNARNSVSFGNGVYKSTDAGDTWRHVGLEDTRHISRILVSPDDPDVAFVGAMGHFFGPNEERGVFRTEDGGETWEKVLYLDDVHGVSDMDMDPSNPNVLFAGLWRFDRKPWTHTTGSEEGGVWRSVDGGDTWDEVEGLPELMGRIGVKVAPSNPEVVYVICESDEGTLFRSTDRGRTFVKVSDDVTIVSRGLYYTDLRVDPANENRLYAVSSRMFLSIDGGRSFQRISRATHVDYHALWIDPTDPRRLWQGQDGGVAVSYDRGETWEPVRNLPLAQFYQVFHDDHQPFYRLGGGLQDNGTWVGPSRTREPAGILQDDWRMISFGDAYFAVAHPERDQLYLSESQAGGIVRTDMRTRQQIDVSPQPKRNDGGPVGDLEYRFNWNAPIIASPHDPSVVYFGGNVVFRSEDFGDTWEVISPDLTTDDPAKQGPAGGPAWVENTTAEYHTTIISLAESPAEADVLWAGTDDGNLQLSRDGGASWTHVVGSVPGVPEFSPVSHVEPSRTEAGVAWVSFDRHMFDDFRPHLFRTRDYGATWTRLGEGLPGDGWIWVVRQDPRNADLLWVGTELGLYASWDGGASFERLHLANLPTVAVHDVMVHPRVNDLIVGTHGRAIWVFDDARPLQDLPAALQGEGAHLFGVRETLRFPTRMTRYGLGDKRHTAPNPPYGALISYYLPESLEPEPEAEAAPEAAAGAAENGDEPGGEGAGEPRLTLEILDSAGEVIRTIEKPGLSQGVHRVAWNLAADGPRQRTDEEPEASEWREPPRGAYVLPGTYTVRLTVDGVEHETPVEVTVDPLVEVSSAALATQHDAAERLVALKERVNLALRSLDGVKTQLEERRATAKRLEVELDDDLEETWSGVEERVTELLESLARPEEKPFWSVGPRLSERLGELFGNVDSAFAAPTAAQAKHLAELEVETEEATSEVRSFLEKDVEALSESVRWIGLPGIALPQIAHPAMTQPGG